MKVGCEDVENGKITRTKTMKFWISLNDSDASQTATVEKENRLQSQTMIEDTTEKDRKQSMNKLGML